MALTPVPPIEPVLPDPPNPLDAETVFDAAAYAWSAALPEFGSDLEAIGAATYANALEAQTQATTATDKAVLTAADRVQTGLDRVQTGLDAAAAAEMDKRYLGAKSTAPTLDNQGAALQTGAVYYDTTLAKVLTWTGSAWVEGISSVAGVTSVNGASGAVTVQPTLVSGTNIKTVNGAALLGSGDLVIASGVTSFDGLTGAVSYAAQDFYVYGLRIGRGGGAVSSNTASGYFALQNNTTGSYNTASGNAALQNNTTGADNTANGYFALPNNTTGSYNTASGNSALYSNTTGAGNTANGYFALPNNTTGSYNTASGYFALYSNTTGSYNTASGNAALQNNTTGSYNTASGNAALQNNTTGAGNIGIGGMNSGGSNSPVFIVTTENNRVVMGSTAVTNAYIKVAWTVVSDARDKTDFAPVPHGLDFVCALQPTAYRFRKSRDVLEADGPVRYGFKAQDVLALEGANPVIVDADDADKLRFNDSSLIPVLVQAIQELRAEFQSYKASHP